MNIGIFNYQLELLKNLKFLCNTPNDHLMQGVTRNLVIPIIIKYISENCKPNIIEKKNNIYSRQPNGKTDNKTSTFSPTGLPGFQTEDQSSSKQQLNTSFYPYCNSKFKSTSILHNPCRDAQYNSQWHLNKFPQRPKTIFIITQRYKPPPV